MHNAALRAIFGGAIDKSIQVFDTIPPESTNLILADPTTFSQFTNIDAAVDMIGNLNIPDFSKKHQALISLGLATSQIMNLEKIGNGILDYFMDKEHYETAYLLGTGEELQRHSNEVFRMDYAPNNIEDDGKDAIESTIQIRKRKTKR